MSDSESSYDDDLYDSFSLITSSLNPLVGDNMTVEELERNSLILIPSPRLQGTLQKQQQQQQQYQQQ